MSQRTERRTIATPARLVSLGMRADEGLAMRAAHFVFALEGQQLYNFPIRNADRVDERVHPDKKVELKMYFPLLAAGCLPQAGRARRAVRAASLEEIASRAGWKAASTVHRNRLRARMIAKRNKRVGGANRYELQVPQGSAPANVRDVSPEAYWNPSLAQLRDAYAPPSVHTATLAETEHAASLPDRSGLKFREDLDDLSGYFYVQPWVWHPANPVSVSARLVFSYLCARGLLQRGSDGRVQTFLQIPLTTVARAVSLRPEAIRGALRQWERLGVLQVFKPPAKRLEGQDGWEQEPLIISYLPGAVLTRDLREVERKRILARAAALRQHTWWTQCGAQLQREIFEHLWTATRNGCALADFQIEVSRRLSDRQVPGDVVAGLFGIPNTPTR